MLRMIEILGEVGITSVLHYVDIGKPLDLTQEEACWEGLIDIYRELDVGGGGEWCWYRKSQSTPAPT